MIRLLTSTLPGVVLLLLITTVLPAQLSINEFLASNSSIIADESGDFEDWIEIYNAGSADVDLGGYYISDNLAAPLAWQIPTTNASLTTVPAGGFLILWADKDIDDGENHIDIKLGADGEDIILVDPDGVTIIDQYTFATQVEDVSFGRTQDGAGDWDYFGQPTPGATNDTPAGAPQVFAPVASMKGGIYSGNITVSLTTSTEDAIIYYTLDGSHPSDNDNEYTGPLTIDENTPLRARAYLDPFIPSSIQTETYLFDISHTMPVIAYTADPDEMFDDDDGMYTNDDDDIEINVNVEMYELNGDQAFNQIVESELNGGGSGDQKSLALKAKSSLGNATIDHQIFPLSERDKYRSLILRNSGQDWNKSFFRDAVGTSLAWDVSDINSTRHTIVEPDIYGQAYRPSITYINGEYWGILNIRERTDKRYIKVHFGLDDDEIDFIENQSEAKDGDLIAYDELEEFLEDNSLNSESNFSYVEDRVDLDNYMDYVAFNIYLDNSDWPGHNHRQFRERVADSKWRYLIFDLDYTFGLRVEGQSWNSGYNNANSLKRLLTLNNSWPNPEDATLLFRKLMENEGWRTKFINRMADQLNILFSDERVTGRIDQFTAIYAPEIQEHLDRWTSGYNNWDENVQIIKDFADGRADNVRDHFVSEISDINGISDIVVNLNNPDDGEVNLSTISVHADNEPFRGTYFEGIDIPVAAYPNRGKVLEKWSGDLSGNNPNEFINISSDFEIIANFIDGSNSTDKIIINEINYNSADNLSSDDWVELYNPNAFPVDISGWYFEDESEGFFGIPANTILAADGYLVLAENGNKFSTIYPQVNNYIGDFGVPIRGFGLSNKGELITLKNAAGILIDEVEYDDKSPWPTAADGDGPTLQLMDPASDNTLPESWEAISATPGGLNGVTSSQNQTITFSAIPDQLNTNAPFQINASASSGLPVSISILSGPATINGNTISLSGSTGVVTVQASQSGNANWNPAPNVTRSFEVTDEPDPPTGEYCDAESTAPWHEWIAGVNLNDLNQTSGKNEYSDFTNLTANLEQGESFDIVLTTGFSYYTYDEYFNVWIDYNQNENFEVNELAYSGILTGVPNGEDTGDLIGTIAVPADALEGTTRMRISMKRGSYAQPCEIFTEGEVEDYTVNIAEGNGSSIVLTSCPDDINQTPGQGQTGMVVNWAAPTANSTCVPNAITVTQTAGPSSGSTFAAGSTTTIAYNLTDDCGNLTSCSFDIQIDNADNGSIALNCSSDLTLTVDQGQTGMIVNWNAPTALTTCLAGGLNVIQDGGAANGSFFDMGTYQISYAATDACGNTESCSFFITVLPNNTGGGDPCASSSDFPWHDWIAEVQFNSIINPSGKSSYSDFTNLGTDITPGATYNITLVTGYSWATFEEHWNVWIDYNKNGTFETPAELAFSGITPPPPNGTENASISGQIIIPSGGLTSGPTTMRISMKRGAAADPCEIIPFGEVEDYTLFVDQSINDNGPQARKSNNSDIQLFPNPASAVLNVVLTNTEVEQLEIFNIAGQKIDFQKGIEGQLNYHINVQNWQRGMYLLRFQLKDGSSITKRFIVGG